MNRNDFHKHMLSGQDLPVLTASELEQLVERYPFFQTAQLLLTKAYLQNGDYRQSDQVQQAALYAGDRSALFRLLRTRKPHVDSQVAMEDEPALVESVTEVALPLVDQPTLESEPPRAAGSMEIPSAEISRMADLIVDENPMEMEVSPEVNTEPIATVLSTATSEVIAPTLSPSVVQEPIMPVLSDNVQEPGLQENILLEALQRSLELEIIADVRQQQQEAEAEEPTENLSPFARWMSQRAKEIEFDSAKRAMPSSQMPEDVQNWLRKPEATIESRLEDLSPEESQGLIAHGSQRMDVPEKKEQQKALIDRFIQREPRITPGKAADYSISDLAKESLEDDLEFVTETMAQLFVFQGKIDRAKKAYKKLMVLHPEKSVYFATQLKNIDRIKKL